MSSSEPFEVPAGIDTDRAWKWVGEDERGVELEVVAIETADMVLIIHAMPTKFRRS